MQPVSALWTAAISCALVFVLRLHAAFRRRCREGSHLSGNAGALLMAKSNIEKIAPLRARF